jgi:hypothetical protein
MPASRPRPKRKEKVFEIDCPVAAQIGERPNGGAIEEGRLQEISIHGARCRFTRPIPAEARVMLHVYFPHPGGTHTTVVFDAVVTSVAEGPPYAVTLRFRGGAKVLRNRFRDLMTDSTT